MANEVIKAFALKHHVPLWMIADRLGIHENTLSRRLRYELPLAEKAKIRGIITALAEEEKKKV